MIDDIDINKNIMKYVCHISDSDLEVKVQQYGGEAFCLMKEK